MDHETPVLVGDIGGTNARFALARRESNHQGIRLDQIKTFPTNDHDSLQSAALVYLNELTGKGARIEPRPRMASIAVAGPVVSDQVSMTNCPWSFCRLSLADDLGMEQVAVLNDFEAIACALPYFRADTLHQIGAGTIQPRGNKLVLGPGTGIGIAALTAVADGWKVLTSEGGHVGFAPTDELEREVLSMVNRQYPRVSVERLISGQGFSTLYQAVAMIKGKFVDVLTPQQITQQALDDPDGDCGQIVGMFCGILGSFAGDMAVTFNATGGVYLAGGILPRIQEFFIKSRFRERFEDKGRLKYVKEIPTMQILEPQPALVGGAVRLQGTYY